VPRQASSNYFLTAGTLLSRSGYRIGAGAYPVMKIYFLLMLMSVFIGLSYFPIRRETNPLNSQPQ
jgi:hypothetical protein